MRRVRSVHANVSDDAHDRWHSFAAERGVSLSALIEVMAWHLDTSLIPELDDDIVIEARKVDAARRRRQ